MADEIQGGLSAVAAEAAPAPAAPAPAQAGSWATDYMQKVQQQKQESFAALEERRKRLLDLQSARKNQMFDPQLLALSSALLRPTKTGGFGESLGYAAEALGGEQEKRLQREQAEAKMQMEIEQMTQEQKRKMMSQELMMNLMGGAPSIQGGVAPVMTEVGAAGMPPVAAGQAPKPEPQKSGLDRFSDQQLMGIAAADPDNSALIMKFIDERRKGKEFGLKEEELGLKKRETTTKEASVKRYLPGVGAVEMPIDFWNKLESAKSFEEVADIYKSKNLPMNVTMEPKTGEYRFMTPEEVSFAQEEKKSKLTEKQETFRVPELGNKTYLMKPSELRALEKAREEGPEAVQTWVDKFQGKSTSRVPSTQEIEAEAAGSKTRAEKLAGSSADKIQTIRDVTGAAPDIVNNANAMIAFSTDPKTKGAFGQFTKPGIISSLGTLVSQGFAAGEYRIGLPAIEEAKLKLTGTQAEIDAANAAAATLANFELAFRVAFLKGQGAVSNTESQTVGKLAGSISDSPKTLEYKAKLLKARGMYDQEFGRKFEDLLDKNPEMTIEKAKRLPEFINLRDNYDKHLVKLQKNFIGSGKPAGGAPSKSMVDRIFGE